MKIKSTSLILQSSGKQVIQCDVVSELDLLENKNILIYGIGKQFSQSDSSSENVFFQLYPKDSNQQKYLNNTIVIDGKSVYTSLYFSNKKEYSGFRIVDLQCWEKMSKILNSTSNFRQIELDDGIEVELIGDIFVTN